MVFCEKENGGGVNGFPFEIKKASENPYKALSEVEMLEKLEKAREHAAQGMY